MIFSNDLFCIVFCVGYVALKPIPLCLIGNFVITYDNIGMPCADE